ncbi:unnamed protein product [Fusarium fujikuroi]|nr:unnamed protein product [Fusarium fujikuroi]
MINEDGDKPSWSSFLIDLDLAIKESREVASGAQGIIGTRAFMAIGALLGEQHSFMHDLESFFWVLFWIYPLQRGRRNQSQRARIPRSRISLPIINRWCWVNREVGERGQITICPGEGDPTGGETGPRGVGWRGSTVSLWRRDVVATVGGQRA